MEQELKFRLPDRAAYDRLAEALGTERTRKLQVNHYLDTPAHDVTRSGKSMLRIRQEGESYILTFKLGVSQESGYFQAEELELEVSTELGESLRRGEVPASAWELEPLRRVCDVFGQQRELVPQGSMSNLRRHFDLPDDEVAELDETTFPNGSVDYELEVETKHPERVLPYLEGLGIELQPQELTKFARFLRNR